MTDFNRFPFILLPRSKFKNYKCRSTYSAVQMTSHSHSIWYSNRISTFYLCRFQVRRNHNTVCSTIKLTVTLRVIAFCISWYQWWHLQLLGRINDGVVNIWVKKEIMAKWKQITSTWTDTIPFRILLADTDIRFYSILQKLCIFWYWLFISFSFSFSIFLQKKTLWKCSRGVSFRFFSFLIILKPYDLYNVVWYNNIYDDFHRFVFNPHSIHYIYIVMVSYDLFYLVWWITVKILFNYASIQPYVCRLKNSNDSFLLGNFTKQL